MNWLAPMTAIYAAAAAVPLLVLLYFLKLKRQNVPVSSTLLWKRAVRDLQVNSPFQKIRWNILLLLQLLILLSLLAALGRPIMSMTTGPARRYVLLIDRSSSMNATDGQANSSRITRLDAAKTQAKEVVRSMRAASSLSLIGGGDQAMVVAFDENAKVMCNFTADKRQLEAAVDSIQPSDGLSSLSQALSVARAFAQPAGIDANNRSAETAAQLELFSDGKIQDLDQLTVAPGELNYHCVGAADKNVAVTAMQASRNYEKSDEVEVFATLSNFGPDAVTCDVQMSLDGNIRAVRSVQVPPRKEPTGKESVASPGATAISFTLTHGQAGIIEVRQLSPDALAGDDAAWAILPPPKALSVLLVTTDNPALESALRACPLAKFEVSTPAEFDAMDQSLLEASRQWDLIVLDRHAPAKLPRGRYMVFGRAPAGSGVQSDQEITNQAVVDWRSQHPVLQYVNISGLFTSRCYKMVLPSDGQVLAEFNDAPALALVRREGSEFLLAPFDCMETNWPFEPSFVMFCYNAVSFLGAEALPQQKSDLKVNQAINMEGLPAGAAVTLTGPGIDKTLLSADASGTIRFPGTSRVGLYNLSVPPRPEAHFAVNLLDAKESDIAPEKQISISGRTVASQKVHSGNTELWPILVLLALVLACAEWLVYNLKMRL